MSKGRVLHFSLACLVLAALALNACGSPPASTTTQATSITTSAAPVTTTRPAVTTTAVSDKPKYGGRIAYRLAGDPLNFDSASQPSGGALLGIVYQTFMTDDWRRGPAGSGVSNLAAGTSSMEDGYGPQIAESWEMPQQGVWILNIRQDVRWQPVNSEAGKLMGGRQLTVDDVIGGFNYLLNRDPKAPAPRSWIVVGTAQAVAKTATIEKTGSWQVTIKTPVEYMTAWVYLIGSSGFYRIYPPDVVRKYGNLTDWRNAVGTGPYMLEDYVTGSQMTYRRNPAYWEKDPVGPGTGNQLPYADTLKELIIPDLSTTYAALRTGKLDLHAGATLADAKSLWQTSPELKYVKYTVGFYGIGMAQENPKNPYSDVRVRRALMLATDFEAIKKGFWGGEAEIINWPANPTLAFYETFDKLTPAVQELYRYNPEKAKKLLAEAGYPNGFKAKLIVQSVPERIDEMSIIKDMWAKVGVEIVLEPKEAGAYASYVGAGVPYPEMLYRVFPGSYYPQHLYQGFTRGPGILNISHVNNPPGTDPYLESLFAEQDKNLFVDMGKVHEAVKKVNRYMMEGAYQIPFPIPNSYNFWWPWLKNHYGQGTPWVRYAWVDQDLKQKMGY